jgi:hypothetical protein
MFLKNHSEHKSMQVKFFSNAEKEEKRVEFVELEKHVENAQSDDEREQQKEKQRAMSADRRRLKDH